MTRPAIVAFALAIATASSLGCSNEEAEPSPGGAGGSGAPAAGAAGTAGDGNADAGAGGSVGGGGTEAGAGGSSAEAGAGGGAEPGAGGSGTGAGAGGSSAEAGAGGTETAGNAGTTGNPYAHVVAVSASGSGESHQFAVSIESADIDCTQFANWWEVLSEDGALLYRRILEHSHTDENGTTDEGKPGNTFTRSGGPVPVGADTVVLVRAHMNTGGYNGRVMRGSASAGFADAPDITSEFAADVEDDAPQSDRCDF